MFAFLGLSLPAFPCSCNPPPSAQASLDASEAVFTGTVVEQRLVNQDGTTQVLIGATDWASIDPSIWRLEVEFDIDRMWKGTAPKRNESVVVMEPGIFRCCYCNAKVFNTGYYYIVYATVDGGSLNTGACSRTTQSPTVVLEDAVALGAPVWAARELSPLATAYLPKAPPHSPLPEGSHINGPLSEQAVADTIDAQKRKILKCVPTGRASEATHAMTVKFGVAPDGRTLDVETMASDMNDAAAEACVRDAFSEVRFPEPPGGEVAVIVYPIRFGP